MGVTALCRFWQVSFGAPDDFEADPTFMQELGKVKSMRFRDGAEFAPAKEYAQLEYSEMREIGAVIDKKAEWCFAIATASTGGLLAAADALWGSVWYCLAAICALLYSMRMSLRARLPVGRSSTFHARTAVEILDDESMAKSFDGRTALTFHLATVGTEIVHRWKCTQLVYAARAVVFAFALAAFAMVVRRFIP